MTQEEKQLLLKDLCARLPYITYYDLSYYGHKTQVVLQEFILAKESLKSLVKVIVKVNTVAIVEPIPYENIKPYLRPMSSMTEEELKENWTFMEKDGRGFPTDLVSVSQFSDGKFTEYLDWLLSHHFDFRGLIEKGLALEAPEGMYKEE